MDEKNENPSFPLKVLRFLCCFSEGHYCCWAYDFSSIFYKEPTKPDIQYILQNADLSDSESTSSTSLLHGRCGSSSPPLSIGSTKDLKDDIYHKIEMRRSHYASTKKTPVIDIKPIEFWHGVKGESVQPTSPASAPPFISFPKSPRSFDKKFHDCEILAKQLRPHLYASTSSSVEETIEEEILGRVHFSAHYDGDESILIVRIIEALDLPLPANKDHADKASSNPYIRVGLLPDKLSTQQTSVKKKTQNPTFEETFVFDIPYHDVKQRTLELKVKDFDKFSRHCVIGHILVPLASINLTRPCRMWRSVAPCSPIDEELGQIMVSLMYLPTAERLNIDIIKAKQLLRTSLLRGADPYVRLSLVVRGRLTKAKKSSIQRNTLDPSFNESFSFKISGTDLKEASLVITVLDYNAGVIKDEFIGRIVIGKQNSGSNEASHWASMLASQRHSVAQWHALYTKDHCDQMLMASRAVH